MSAVTEPTPVLFLAWYFPPIGGAGVQRSLKFVRQLPEHGFQPIVLAGPGTGGNRWAPADATLAAELPPGLVVHRPAALPSPSSWQRLGTRLVADDLALRRHWHRFVLDAGVTAARTHRARMIFVTLGPFECLPAALELGRRTGLPVVADLRDPWALDEMRSYGHWFAQWCDASRMRSQLLRCERIVMNTPTAAGLLRQRLPELAPRIDCITNGYDASDFEAPVAARADDRFRIVHTGYLHSDVARHEGPDSMLRRLRGGKRHGVDLWGRTHRYLLAAIERLHAAAPDLGARIELHLHGVLSADDDAVTVASPVRDLVHRHGYCSHAEAIAAMRGADLLFLPMQGLPPGQRATIVPGKTYEYLASRRPILAAVPSGDARDFVAAVGGVVVDPADVDGMATAMRRLVSAGRQPDRVLGPEVTRFERRELTRCLARVLHEVLRKTT